MIAGHAARPDRVTALVAIYGNPDYYPPTFNAVRILANHFKVHIVCRQYGEVFRNWPAGVTIERLGEDADISRIDNKNPLSKWLEFKRYSGAVRDAVKRLSPAFIYAYEAHAYAAAIRSGALKAEIPILLHFHETPEPGSLMSLGALIVRYVLRKVGLAEIVVLPDRFRGEVYRSLSQDPRPSLIIPNCAASDFFPRPRDWNSLRERRWTTKEILYLSAIAPTNGHREVISALERMPSNIKLRFVGRVSQTFHQDLKRSAIRLSVNSRFIIEPFVSQEVALGRLESACLGLCLYKPVNRNWEYCGSAGNKVFEYAAAGLPAIVPDRISYRDFFKDEPWIVYVNQDDPEEIASGINFILEDRERYFMMGRAARRAFEERFNYERVFQPLLERILEMLGGKRICTSAGRLSA